MPFNQTCYPLQNSGFADLPSLLSFGDDLRVLQADCLRTLPRRTNPSYTCTTPSVLNKVQLWKTWYWKRSDLKKPNFTPKILSMNCACRLPGRLLHLIYLSQIVSNKPSSLCLPPSDANYILLFITSILPSYPIEVGYSFCQLKIINRAQFGVELVQFYFRMNMVGEW